MTCDQTVPCQGNTESISPDSISYISPGLKIGCEEFEINAPEDGSPIIRITDHFAWIKVAAGKLAFEINGEEITVSEGETLFVNYRVPYFFRGTRETPVRFRIMIAAPDAVKVPDLDQEIERLASDRQFTSTLIHPVSSLFSYEADAILDLIRHKPDLYEFDIVSKYCSLMRQYCRIHRHVNPDETVRSDMEMESLREMLAWIAENHRTEISVDEIAASGRMSRSKCSRMFRKYLGKSPIEYVQKYRLEKSVFLLKNTNLQFSEIASLCGFNQQSYFNRLFVREYGVTPREMRRASVSGGAYAEKDKKE